MTRDFSDYFQDILDPIDETAEFTRDLTIEEFRKDRKTVNAVIRSLETLGEAAKRIPNRIRLQAPDVPWRRMTGMRDKLIHDYFGVDLTIVWTVIQEELPPLRPLIAQLIVEIQESSDDPS